MTDFTTHAHRWCSSNEHYSEKVAGSKPGVEYTVTYGKTPRGPYQYGWSCTCPSFKHRGGECKHIKAVKPNHCRYGWEASCGSPAPFEDDTCPSCGGETSVISVAA